MIGFISLQFSIDAMRKGVTTLICLLLVSVMLSGCIERIFDQAQEEYPGTENVFRATDADESPTEGKNDTLLTIDWDEAYEDLNWGFVVIKLQSADNVYDCTITGTEECLILQDGDRDDLWETHESLTIMENDTYIVGSTPAQVHVHISYRGVAVSGTDSLAVD